MINLTFKENAQLMYEVQDKYNELAENYYPDILGYSYYELWKKSNGYLTPDLWRDFLLHPKVKDWYDVETNLMLRSKANELLRLAGSDNSTGKAQQLGAIFKQINEQKEDYVDPTVFIYTFVPLTQDEKDNENVTILNFIPDEIDRAIQVHTKRD